MEWHKVECGSCGRVSWICPSCWRGQRYCSIDCKVLAQRKSRRVAQLKYSKTPGFKEDRREYQRQYRGLDNHPP